MAHRDAHAGSSRGAPQERGVRELNCGSLLPLVLATPNPFPLELGRGSKHCCSRGWQLTCFPHRDIPAVTHSPHPTHQQQRWGQENKLIAAKQLLGTLRAAPQCSPGHGAARQRPARPLRAHPLQATGLHIICHTGSPPHFLSAMLPLPFEVMKHKEPRKGVLKGPTSSGAGKDSKLSPSDTGSQAVPAPCTSLCRQPRLLQRVAHGPRVPCTVLGQWTKRQIQCVFALKELACDRAQRLGQKCWPCRTAGAQRLGGVKS